MAAEDAKGRAKSTNGIAADANLKAKQIWRENIISKNYGMGATVRIVQESWCLLYAGFIVQ